MGYLEKAQASIREYGPKLEEMFDVDIESNTIKAVPFTELFDDISENNSLNSKSKIGNRVSKALSYILWKIITNSFTMAVLRDEPEKVYVKPTKKNGLLKGGVIHELGHKIQDGLEAKLFILPPILDRKARKAFREGFATYIMLEYPEIYRQSEDAQIYIGETKRKLNKEGVTAFLYDLNRFFRGTPYRKGYKFWSCVIGKLGKEKITEVLENPPFDIREIEDPGRYIKRLNAKRIMRREGFKDTF